MWASWIKKSGEIMEKPFEIREYETLHGNKDYAGQYKCLEKGFDDLLNFIAAFDASNEDSDVLDFIKIGYMRNIGKTVTFRNYVGLIQMKNGEQVQVLPKIDFRNEERDNTKEVFMRMLRSMKDFPEKVFTNANLATEKMSLYEIFIYMYIQDVWGLIKKGLKSAYVRQEDNLGVYKGKLLVNEQIKHNLAHKERFYVAYDEYQVNRPENMLIKATLLKLQKITTSAGNNKELKKILSMFEAVDHSTNYDRDFAKVSIDRSTKDYESILKWSKGFLKDKSFTTFSGDATARALMFPMEKVFEAYVAKNMKKIFERKGWEVSAQDRGYYLFNTLNGEKYRKFALRPDLVVSKPDKTQIILDTKWKSLVNDKGKNYGISQADMYQMYAYSKKYGTSDIWLLYPVNDEMRKCGPIRFESGDDDNVSVSLFFVDVTEIERSMEELFSLLNSN